MTDNSLYLWHPPTRRKVECKWGGEGARGGGRETSMSFSPSPQAMRFSGFSPIASRSFATPTPFEAPGGRTYTVVRQTQPFLQISAHIGSPLLIASQNRKVNHAGLTVRACSAPPKPIMVRGFFSLWGINYVLRAGLHHAEHYCSAAYGAMFSTTRQFKWHCGEGGGWPPQACP